MKHNNTYLKKLLEALQFIKYIAIFLMILLGIIVLFSINSIVESGGAYGLIVLILFFISVFLLINFIFNIANTLMDMSLDITNLYIEKNDINLNIKEKNHDYIEELDDLISKSTSTIFEKNNVDSLDEYLKKLNDKYK